MAFEVEAEVVGEAEVAEEAVAAGMDAVEGEAEDGDMQQNAYVESRLLVTCKVASIEHPNVQPKIRLCKHIDSCIWVAA